MKKEMIAKGIIFSWRIPPSKSGSAIIVETLAKGLDGRIILIGERVNKSLQIQDLNSIYYHLPRYTYKFSIIKWFFLPFVFFKTLNRLVIDPDKPMYVLSVYPLDFDLILGLLIAKKLRIPYFTWFHNTYTENNKGFYKFVAKGIQNWVFRNSKVNFVMSDGLLRHYRINYPNYRFETLVHPFYFDKNEPNATTVSTNKNKISLCFTGTLNQSCIESMTRMIKIIKKSDNLELHIYSITALDEFCRIGMDESEKFIYHGFVKDEDFNKEIRQYDIMLLLNGFSGSYNDIEYQTIFPTRGIPLLRSGRPIFCHSPKGSFLSEFMKNHNCAFVVENKDEYQIIDMIYSIIRSKNIDFIIKNALEVSELFEAQNVVKKFQKEIKKYAI